MLGAKIVTQSAFDASCLHHIQETHRKQIAAERFSFQASCLFQLVFVLVSLERTAGFSVVTRDRTSSYFDN